MVRRRQTEIARTIVERELRLDWPFSLAYTRSGDHEERRRAGVTDGSVLNWDHVCEYIYGYEPVQGLDMGFAGSPAPHLIKELK